ncbi:MAG: Rrf2 family transcriptional regulator [Oscillospiraceae bacterium]|nr:Rrf2 family transcriptional regulator [Oscillospiraceae bacterium]MBQ9719802.1 Rrf2 family transcriptional regulator [Oscillospiraceae bacterium]
MMISTRGRYALRMMLDLAEYQGEGYVALKDVARRQEISKKYLEQIIPILNRAELLQTTRGYQGGYRLARKPVDYTLGDILRATEGSLAPVSCLEGDVNLCTKQADCATLPIWAGLDKVINEYLDSITLQDVLDEQNSRRGNDYVI